MDKENRGALFKHIKTKDTQPDFKGYVNIKGVDYQLAGWKRVSSKTGETFISLQISENKSEPKKENKTDFLDDDIGF